VFAGLALMDAEILEVAENINPATGAITRGNVGIGPATPRSIRTPRPPMCAST
jgi:catecholate siderophore receptor